MRTRFDFNDSTRGTDMELSPVFCDSFFSQHWAVQASTFLIPLVSFGFSIFTVRYIYKHRKEIPIRQRAPMLSIVHVTCNSMLIFLYLFIDILFRANIFDWTDDVLTEKDIPLSRMICKFLVCSLRTALTFLSLFRLLVIWVQWKKLKLKLFQREIDLRNEKNITGLFMVIWSAVILLFFGTNGILMNRKPIIDWYIPNDAHLYRFINMTTIRLVESSLFLGAWWLVREFPENLNIKREYEFIFVMVFLYNAYQELTIKWKEAHRGCLFFMIKSDYVATITRSLLINLVMVYFYTIKDFHPVPNPECVTFYQMMNIPLYRKHFRLFILNKSVEKIEKLDDTLQNLHLVKLEDVDEYGKEFILEYQEYKSTKSYHRIKKILQDDYNVWSIGIDNK